MNITWKIEKEEHQTQQVSEDGRWSLNFSHRTGSNPQMFLLNRDLLACPSGMADNEIECYRKFIESCDRYSAQLQKIRLEAESHLQALAEKAGE